MAEEWSLPWMYDNAASKGLGVGKGTPFGSNCKGENQGSIMIWKNSINIS